MLLYENIPYYTLTKLLLLQMRTQCASSLENSINSNIDSKMLLKMLIDYRFFINFK